MDLFISSDASTYSTVAFLPLRNSDVISVTINFLSSLKWDILLYSTAYDYFPADWDSLHDDLRDVGWEDIFKLGPSAAGTAFCKWIQVEIDICHLTYRVTHHSPLWFSATCAVATAHRCHLFHF